MIIDISQEILSCQVYPGDTTPSAHKMMDMAKGDLYNLTNLSMCAHNGTHIDAPRHFIKDGKTVDMLPLSCFVGHCFVAHHSGQMSASDAVEIMAQAQKAKAMHRILIAGDSVVTPQAAEVFAENKILLLGVESQSVGPVNAPMAVHKILLSQEIVLLEGLVLKNIPQGRYFLSAQPLNIAGAEGAPCRAILIGDKV